MSTNTEHTVELAVVVDGVVILKQDVTRELDVLQRRIQDLTEIPCPFVHSTTTEPEVEDAIEGAIETIRQHTDEDEHLFNFYRHLLGKRLNF
jgi:hypothetical protein